MTNIKADWNSPAYWVVFTNAPRQLKIVELREKGLTYSAIGKEVGLTLERVRQIYKRLDRTRNSLERLRIGQALQNLKEISVMHFKNPHAINNIQLLGEMPPEDGEPFGFVK